MFKIKNKYLILKKNNNCDILFYNNSKKLQLDIKYNVQNLDINQINLYYLIKAIFTSIIKLNFKIKSLKDLYFYEIIKSFNPKIFI